MRTQGVLRSTLHGLTPWQQGLHYPNGFVGIQDGEIILVGKLHERLGGEEFRSALVALASGVGRGMAATAPERNTDPWRRFALAAVPEPEPLVMGQPFTVKPEFPLDSYQAIRTKFGHDPAKFQAFLGRQLQRAWCKGRRAAGRPLVEIAAQIMPDDDELRTFAGTCLGQTQVIRLTRMFERLPDAQPNHVACLALYACTRWSPASVESVICEAYEVGVPLNTLRLHQVLEYAHEHSEVERLPVEFRLLMAFE